MGGQACIEHTGVERPETAADSIYTHARVNGGDVWEAERKRRDSLHGSTFTREAPPASLKLTGLSVCHVEGNQHDGTNNSHEARSTPSTSGRA